MKKSHSIIALAGVLVLSSVLAWAGQVLQIDGHAVTLQMTNVFAPKIGLVTGSQPSAQDLQQLHQAGVTTVVDLRPVSENRGYDEAAAAASLGLRYINIAVAGADDVTPEKAAELDRALQQAGKQTVLIHCASGNRVGALLALRASKQGLSADAALQFGLSAGLTSLQGRVKEQLPVH